MNKEGTYRIGTELKRYFTDFVLHGESLRGFFNASSEYANCMGVEKTSQKPLWSSKMQQR